MYAITELESTIQTCQFHFMGGAAFCHKLVKGGTYTISMTLVGPAEFHHHHLSQHIICLSCFLKNLVIRKLLHFQSDVG